MNGVPRPQKVRFAPTPEEEQLWALAVALRNLVLWLLFWPVLLPWRLLVLGERLAARALGVYFGLLQGGAYAAATIAHLLLSRGGVRRLVWGADVARVARAASVPVPGTPPHADASAERVSSDALNAAIAAAAAALQAAQPATEPAVPSPLTPPVVAPAAQPAAVPQQKPQPLLPGGLPPTTPSPAALRGRLGEAPAAYAAAPDASAAAQQQAAARLGLGAAYARALARSAEPGGPHSMAAAVEDWQQGVDAAAARQAGQEGQEGTEGRYRRQLHLGWQELQAKKAALHAMKDREERLLAAFEAKGPQAQQAAAAWLASSEPIMASSSTDVPHTAGADVSRSATPSTGGAAGAFEGGGTGGSTASSGAAPGTAVGQASQLVSAPVSAAAPKPQRSASAASLGSGGGAGSGGGFAQPPLPPVAQPEPRPLSAADVRRSGSAGSSAGGGGLASAVRALSGRLFGGSSRAPSASVSAASGAAERMASHPLPDLWAEEGASSGGEEEAEEGVAARLAAVGPVGEALRAGGLQAAAAGAAAEEVKGVRAGLAGAELAGEAGLPSEDSMEITRHTKHEKR